jgi:hypothetical protein
MHTTSYLGIVFVVAVKGHIERVYVSKKGVAQCIAN